jgi:hypothetical protein
MAKASYLVAKQANDIADAKLLLIALCKKLGVDPEKVIKGETPEMEPEAKPIKAGK